MKKIIYILPMLALVLASCGGKNYFKEEKVEPVNVEIVRFDSALLSLPLDSTDIRIGVRKLWAAYPDFMTTFTEDLIGIYPEDTDALCEMLPGFLTDTLYGFQATNKKEQEVFADISDIKNQLGLAFGRIKALYPDAQIPILYMFVSGFQARLMWMGDDLCIGTDMYLGSDYEYYNRVVYEYQKQTMRKECIPADVINAYLFHLIPWTSNKNRLLENMIYQGKINWLMQQLLPDEKPWEIIGYTEEKWNWCKKHEKAIWSLMMDKQDIYTSDHTKLTSYMNDGPFTSEISQDAPARLGTWVGWMIVDNYMKNNPDVTVKQLMQEGDAQKVLEMSKYRP